MNIPNGDLATKGEMIEIQDTIRSYVADMGVYFECIVTEEVRSISATNNLSPEVEQKSSQSARQEVQRCDRRDGGSRASLTLENCIYSAVGSFGITISHEDHALVDGSKEFVAALKRN